MIGIALFVVASLAILRLSWRSLHNLRAHGFYRFFAFELLAGLIAMNLPIWFRYPWSARQIASYINTATLVSVGAYRFIRHPLYTSLLALAICAWLKAPRAAMNIAIALATAVFLLATALAEEKENLARFGVEYAEYAKRTRRFVPFLF